MILQNYQDIPLRINPVAFDLGPLPVSWYSLAYLAAFGVIWSLTLLRMREEGRSREAEGIFWEFSLLFGAAILGGRVGYALFYAPQTFWADPWWLFNPFGQDGFFTGIRGMSYFGALLGVLGFAFWRFRSNLTSLGSLASLFVPALGAGYFLGRIGNFLGGELYGKITAHPWGMRFAEDPLSLRHPVQLYEAFLEGALVFLVFWMLRKEKSFPFISGYVALYCTARFFCEFFRQQESWIWGLTQGQVFSVIFLLASLALFPLERKKCYNPKEGEARIAF